MPHREAAVGIAGSGHLRLAGAKALRAVGLLIAIEPAGPASGGEELEVALGALLPILATNVWSFALSAVLFGGSFLAVVTAVTRQVRQTLPPARWTAVMGNATALFAIGQLVGPTLTGAIADRQGGLALGLLCSGALLGIATLVALLGPQPTPSR